MGDAQFLMPKAKTVAFVIVGMVAAIPSAASTTELAAVLVGALVVIVAGVFTLRNNLKTFWKDLAEERGEQVKVLETELKQKAQQLLDAQLEHTEAMAKFADEQREVRHQLKNERDTLAKQLELEQAKHDLSGLAARIEGLEHTLDARSPMFEQMAAGIVEQSGLLTEIRDELVARPPQPREATT